MPFLISSRSFPWGSSSRIALNSVTASRQIAVHSLGPKLVMVLLSHSESRLTESASANSLRGLEANYLARLTFLARTAPADWRPLGSNRLQPNILTTRESRP